MSIPATHSVGEGDFMSPEPTPQEKGSVEGEQGSPSNRVKASPELVLAALSEVYDPEIGIDIVSLGLVYGSHIDDNGLLTIDMTLTTPYCPMGSIIQGQAHAVCHGLPGVEDVRVNLVWDPPWDPRTMASEEARLDLGIY